MESREKKSVDGYDPGMLDALKKSPMFNLSLSSKELFHSNFLAWLAEKNPEKFIELIKYSIKCYLGKTDKNSSDNLFKTFEKKLTWADCFISKLNCYNEDIWYSVEREYDNFDLCILRHVKKSPDDDEESNYKELPVFILENKVKSIATLNQLEEYVDKAESFYTKKYNENNEKENICYILLSLAPISSEIKKNAICEIKEHPNSNNETEHNQYKQWFCLDYETLCTKLPIYYNDSEIKHKSYIKDYRYFITKLCAVKDVWLGEEKDNPQNLFTSKESMCKLRIDDIRQKVIYSCLLEKLKEKMKSDFTVFPISSDDYKHVLSGDLKSKSKWKNRKYVQRVLTKLGNIDGNKTKPLVMVNLDYGRTGALVQMKFKLKDLKNDLICVIQVQNQGYRIGVEFLGKTLSECPKTPPTYIPNELYPTNPIVFRNNNMAKIDYKRKNDNTPRRYAPSYFYEFCSFDKDVSIEDVVDQLIYDLNRYGKKNIVPLQTYL